MASRKAEAEAARVDALYGLEPVFEPGRSVHPEDWLILDCPFCGESIGTTVDLSGGSRSYVEDCQVCCQPMVVHISCAADGSLRKGWAERGD